MKKAIINLFCVVFLVSCIAPKKHSTENPNGYYKGEMIRVLKTDPDFEKIKIAYERLSSFSSTVKGTWSRFGEQYLITQTINGVVFQVHVDNSDIRATFSKSVSFKFNRDFQTEDVVAFEWFTTNDNAKTLTREKLIAYIIAAGNAVLFPKINLKTFHQQHGGGFDFLV
ncbi:MAG TPA: hypothetical protein VLB02_02945 [Candidatus Paceibacterota bacterium]|nr:hypothetical protein [Candidatus Paceibacterota bacterium]